MLPPSEFARAAVVHGTVATVSDPHEIANVLGVEGVRAMIRDGKRTAFKFYFSAPSCVPATPFETAGATFGIDEIESLLDEPDIKYLGEVMNFPAVINRDPTLMSFIAAARKRDKRVDGHAPGVSGEALKQYISAGIETDHECVTIEEGRERLQLGMKLAIREGSAARNFDALIPLVKEFGDQCFLCSDDKHPDELMAGHINVLVKRAIAYGIDPITALRIASLNPVKHYGLEVGLLQSGDPANVVEIDSLEQCRVRRAFIDGRLVAENGVSLLERLPVESINVFNIGKKQPEDFVLPAREGAKFAVIEAIDGQIRTERCDLVPAIADGCVVADSERDLLKITVVNRYHEAKPAVGLVRGFTLKTGALASSVAHDSHNIIAVGASDEALCRAVNLVVEQKGGLSAVVSDSEQTLALPIAGLMSDQDYPTVARQYHILNEMMSKAGCRLKAPYMLLSFLALPVIPKLKLSDLGLFDVEQFKLIDPWSSGAG